MKYEFINQDVKHWSGRATWTRLICETLGALVLGMILSTIVLYGLGVFEPI